MKRIVSALLCAVLLIVLIPKNIKAASNLESDAWVAEFLQELRIIDSAADNGLITRAEFVLAALNLRGMSNVPVGKRYFQDVPQSHWAFNEVSAAVALGIVSVQDGNMFRPDARMNVQDAAVMMLRVLNYGNLLEQEQGSYKTDLLIKENKLLNGIADAGNGTMTPAAAYRMLYNTLCADYFFEGIFGSGITNYVAYKGENLLSIIFDVYKIEGQMTANDITGIFGASPQNKNCVLIGDKSIYDSNRIGMEYLGQKVIAFVKQTKDSDQYQLIKIFEKPKANEVRTVMAVDLDRNNPNFNARRVVACAEGGKQESFRLSIDFACVYNGELYESITAQTFKIKEGYIKFIDTDNDSEYDVVMIEEYEICVAGRVNPEKQTVTDLYTGLTLDLSPKAIKRTDFSFADGSPAAFADISVNSVLSIFCSKTGKYMRVVISKEKKSLIPECITFGDNTAIDSVTAGNREYRISSYFTDTADKIRIGERRVCYFDMFGYIVAADDDNTKGKYYGYLTKMYLPTGLKNPEVQIFTENNDLLSVGMADTVYYNDVKTKSRAALSDFVKDEKFEKQLVMYELDNDGCLGKLWKYKNMAALPDYNFKSPDLFSLDYQSNSGSQYREGRIRSIDSKFILTDNTKVFVVSNDEDADARKFSCTNYSVFEEKNAGSYNFELYDINKDYTVSVVVNLQDFGTEQYDTYAPMFVVDKVTDTLTPEGEACKKLLGYEDGVYTSYFAEEDASDKGGWIPRFNGITVSQLKRGDVIQRSMNASGKIKGIRILYKADYPDAYDEKSNGDITAENMYAALYTSSARALEQYESTITVLSNRLETDPAQKHIRTLPLDIVGAFYYYDKERNRLTLTNKYEDISGKNIFFALIMNDIKLIVVYD